jgi:hypothetical protein
MNGIPTTKLNPQTIICGAVMRPTPMRWYSYCRGVATPRTSGSHYISGGLQ